MLLPVLTHAEPKNDYFNQLKLDTLPAEVGLMGRIRPRTGSVARAAKKRHQAAQAGNQADGEASGTADYDTRYGTSHRPAMCRSHS